MSNVTFKDLLEAGTHFGHQTRRWHPKMKRFVLAPRNGIYIIDLQKTLDMLGAVTKVVQQKVRDHGRILFVGTKKPAQSVIKEEAVRCGMHYVCTRWLGGMLTNFETIRKSVKQLDDIEALETSGDIKFRPKKEAAKLLKKKEKLLTVLEGVRTMKQLPSLLFVVDSKNEQIAVAEARRLNIDIAAIVDTNADPDEVTYPIPGNDDAIKSIHLITKAVSDAVIEVTGKEAVPVEAPTAAEAAVAPAPAVAEEADEDKAIRRVTGPRSFALDSKAGDEDGESKRPAKVKRTTRRITPKRKPVGGE